MKKLLSKGLSTKVKLVDPIFPEDKEKKSWVVDYSNNTFSEALQYTDIWYEDIWRTPDLEFLITV